MSGDSKSLEIIFQDNDWLNIILEEFTRHFQKQGFCILGFDLSEKAFQIYGLLFPLLEICQYFNATADITDGY